MKIAINGMGRIGRLLFKRIWEAGKYDIVAVNDIMPQGNLTYLLKYDSIYGNFSNNVALNNGEWTIEGKKVKVLSQSDPGKLPWKELEIDVVLECSGRFLFRKDAAKHLNAGASKVLLSTTGKADIPLRVWGFSSTDEILDTDILSPGGCMTNCSTHVINLLNEIGIESALINIIHSFTSRQHLVDSAHNQYRRGRAASESIIPVDIDLCVALARLFPGLAGKIAASSVRVPVPNGAYANFYVQLKKPADAEALKDLFRSAARGSLKEVMQYTEEPLVSLDIKTNTHSCIIDGTEITSIGNLARVSAWFDNEYGFTSRMIDWLEVWGGVGGGR